MAAILSGLPEDENEYSKGGIKYFLIGLKSSFNFTIDENIVTSITLKPGINGTVFNNLYKYVPVKETSGYTVTSTGNKQTASLFYEHQINMTFGKDSAEKITEVRKLAKSKVFAICIGYSCGDEKAFLVGREGLELTTGTGQSGVASGDLNGQTVTLACSDCSPEAEIPLSMIDNSWLIIGSVYYGWSSLDYITPAEAKLLTKESFTSEFGDYTASKDATQKYFYIVLPTKNSENVDFVTQQGGLSYSVTDTIDSAWQRQKKQ